MIEQPLANSTAIRGFFISGDTVLTDDIKRALNEFKPDINVVAAARAQMDVGQPLLMSTDEVMEFIRLLPNQVITNHMDALNHCDVSRSILKDSIANSGLLEKILIPENGDTLEFNV
ncbi:hypothetical protein [uncultured Vibrio sp.]|uniref:hypothetical protein n=1 Tax=uncultured Vibrio sp. TaxID=114054 RepID=UPI00262CF1BF|nr:hypothetical protein [uncultured Vibrio sp.]